ncbi:MAG TPA: hypothetical protein VHF05_00860 [Candidatus Paceibacterota bacterium]|jgi:hypothetical protein|nr:hypothetical protein [Candidatus Paceibacterota bacterium]
MNKKNKIVLSLIILLGVISLGLLAWHGGPGTNGVLLKSEVPQTQDWKTYQNVAHGYAVSYPEDAAVQPVAEMEGKPVEQSDDIIIEIPGVGEKFGATIYLPFQNAPKALTEERNKLIMLPLFQFAESIRQMQLDDTNPYTKNKKVGGLNEIDLEGQKAYSFTLTKSFSQGLAGGYSLGKEGTVFNFVFVENKSGEKIMIHYPLNDDVAERMIDSFELQ